MPPKKRCFIAINPPLNIKKELSLVINKLRKMNKYALIKWSKAESLHITLCFLDSLDREEISKVDKYLQNLIKQYPTSKLKLDGIGVFPNLKNPRVIYIQAPEADRIILPDLSKKLNIFLESLAIDINRRPWRSHITLGRVKKDGVKLKIDDVKINPLEFKLKSIELMESELTANGPNYKIIKSYQL